MTEKIEAEHVITKNSIRADNIEEKADFNSFTCCQLKEPRGSGGNV